jgi:hypothetical protein
MELAHHALHSLSSRIFGFHQDLFDDSGRQPDPEAEARLIAMLAVSYPALAELARSASHEGGLGACDDDVEFAFGLDLILDGSRATSRRGWCKLMAKYDLNPRAVERAHALIQARRYDAGFVLLWNGARG